MSSFMMTSSYDDNHIFCSFYPNYTSLLWYIYTTKYLVSKGVKIERGRSLLKLSDDSTREDGDPKIFKAK